jgi:hypothetical protein
MENLSEVSGYVASTLVVSTFVAKDMRLLRTIAPIFSNLAFIGWRYRSRRHRPILLERWIPA